MYENLLSRIYNQPHLIRPEKLDAIRRVVTDRALGFARDASLLAAMQNESTRTRKVSIARDRKSVV